MTWSKVEGVGRPTLDEQAEVLVAEEAFAARQKVERWDERGCCHDCGHWNVTYCNVDGFSYCDTHYPEGLR